MDDTRCDRCGSAVALPEYLRAAPEEEEEMVVTIKWAWDKEPRSPTRWDALLVGLIVLVAVSLAVVWAGALIWEFLSTLFGS
jgi:hypothetical protein